MEKDNAVSVPVLPPEFESRDQDKAPPEQTRALIASGKNSAGEYLGKALPIALSGIGAQQGDVTFNTVGLAALIANLQIHDDERKLASMELSEARERNRNLQELLGKEQVRAAIAETSLKHEISSSRLTNVMIGIGSCCLGLLPFVYDKAQVIGAITIGALGCVLILAPRLVSKFGDK